MSNLRKSKYVQLAKHPFDVKSIRQTQQAVNALLNNEIVVGSKAVGRIHNSDSNTVIELPAPPSTEIVFPFQIYSVKNITATPDQIAQFTSVGLNINDFTFQVRSGIVGARTYINSLTSNIDGSIQNTIGNFEQDLYVGCTDGFPNLPTGTEIDFYYPQSPNKNGITNILDSSGDILLYGTLANSSPDDGYPFVTSAQITMNPTVDNLSSENSAWHMALWLEIVDDANNGSYVNLMGRMFSGDGDTIRTTIPFPEGANIIPLGTVVVTYSGESNTGPKVYFLTQIQGGNLVNRWTPGSTTLRGRWVEIYAALPAGLTNLNFYPGDIVVDDSAFQIFAGTNYYGVYQCIAAAPISSVVANVPQHSGFWKQVGMTPN